MQPASSFTKNFHFLGRFLTMYISTFTFIEIWIHLRSRKVKLDSVTVSLFVFYIWFDNQVLLWDEKVESNLNYVADSARNGALFSDVEAWRWVGEMKEAVTSQTFFKWHGKRESRRKEIFFWPEFEPCSCSASVCSSCCSRERRWYYLYKENFFEMSWFARF